MRKFFPALLAGLLAVSFSQLAAAQSTTQSNTGDNPNATTTDQAKPAKKQHKSAMKQRKDKDRSAASGGTSAGPSGNTLPTTPDRSAAPDKSDSDTKAGKRSPGVNEKSD